MKIIEKNLSTSELAELKKQQKELMKKILSDSVIISMLTFFGLMLLLLACEKFGLNIQSVYIKPAFITLSILIGTIYYLKALHKFNTKDSSIQRVIQYTFTITDFYSELVSNTEYVIYACKTTDNKTVVFHTSQLRSDRLYDTLIIELVNQKIVSINNYSTGMTVKQLSLDKQLLGTYDEAFYLLEKDINNL